MIETGLRTIGRLFDKRLDEPNGKEWRIAPPPRMSVLTLREHLCAAGSFKKIAIKRRGYDEYVPNR
ncbi:hypothetical protein FHT02_003346 [Sphingomonas xinjiangensis]|uniref:Uncharacterized protein n=1 Tax=Sphingomonas xinjiangensis TaxID=643568 RepID=A0A840YPC1_9SPHN|nr:hypothetical protein [Sphingomonas xinjiangensis]